MLLSDTNTYELPIDLQAGQYTSAFAHLFYLPVERLSLAHTHDLIMYKVTTLCILGAHALQWGGSGLLDGHTKCLNVARKTTRVTPMMSFLAQKTPVQMAVFSQQRECPIPDARCTGRRRRGGI